MVNDSGRRNMNSNMRLRADLALALTAGVWGGTFVMVKTAVEDAAVLPFLSVRFGLAALALAVPAVRTLLDVSRVELGIGLLVGVFLGSGYALQTFGLRLISSSEAAFLTGLGTVLVPFLGIFAGRRPTAAALLGVGLAALGTGLVSYGDDKPGSGLGEALVIGCAAVFALHLAVQGEFASHCNAVRLAVVQLASAACVCGLGWALLPSGWDPGTAPTEFTPKVWGAAAFLAVFATAAAFVVQAWAQRFTTPTHTALMFSLEPVFGALFGIWLAGDRLAPINWAGCGMILSGILASEWKTPVPPIEAVSGFAPAPATGPSSERAA